ncbi:N-acetylgalactosamine kinase isoform X10 [Trachypithecus francoisi]|uniref:N-acetylgalactosamine kinase isoform X10 n=1 Tax=Trachypithecus francoisi TaxID=54180 RepID=UPI00141BD326|nr:N-acetylgalactosamine kinase isoform X10 [Trachypithecus francoisi]
MAAESPAMRWVQVAEHPRLLKLKEMFNSKFGSIPKFYVRAPGRVNIIGEHIDYCGYSVLPMAIEQDVLIAVEPVKTYTLQLANTNPLYPDFSTSANNIQIDKTKALWHNYFLCGLKGIQEHFGLSNLTGMNCLVDGNIPPSSGLSSSSALVCCAGLVTLTVLGRNLSKLLAKYKNLQWDNVLRLEEVQAKLGISLEEMLLVTEDALHPEPYNPEEICRCLGISLEELRTQILSPNTQGVLIFKLYQRAKHVYSEAARVLQFKKICEEAPENMVQLLGELMNQSHMSCQDMYECSCPELDQLVDICRSAGVCWRSAPDPVCLGITGRGCTTVKTAACSFLWKLCPRGAPARCQPALCFQENVSFPIAPQLLCSNLRQQEEHQKGCIVVWKSDSST